MMNHSWPVSKKTSFFIGLLVFITTTTFYLPSSIITSSLSTISQPQVKFTEPSGTVWNGGTDVIIGESQAHKLGHLAWQIQWSGLWKLHLPFVLSWNAQPLAEVYLSKSKLEFHQLHLPITLSQMRRAYPFLSTLSLGGKLIVDSQTFSISQESFQGDIFVHLEEVFSGLTPINPLGKYELHLQGDQQSLLMHLQSLQGPLWVEANGKWSNQHGLNLVGKVRAEPSQSKVLSPLLHLMGNESQTGEFSFQL